MRAVVARLQHHGHLDEGRHEEEAGGGCGREHVLPLDDAQLHVLEQELRQHQADGLTH